LGVLDGSECSGDGCDRGTGFNRGGTGYIGDQRLPVLLRRAQMGVGLDERFLLHRMHDSNSVGSFNRFEVGCKYWR
jgi:hypothetical protein